MSPSLFAFGYSSALIWIHRKRKVTHAAWKPSDITNSVWIAVNTDGGKKGWILNNNDNKIKWTKERKKERKKENNEGEKKKRRKQKLKPNYKIPKIP